MDQSRLDADLTAFYRAEANAGMRVEQGEFRRGLRSSFVALLDGQSTSPQERPRGPSRLLDVGAGPGLDTLLWHDDGFDAVGLDLVGANVSLLRSRGVDGVVGSLYELPFAAASFDVLWTMSTFVHVPHDRFDAAMTEMLRVVRPGALLGIGTWGGPNFEGLTEFGEIRPFRFFSLAADERWQAMLARHATVERFETHRPEFHHEWEYQFAVVRAPD